MVSSRIASYLVILAGAAVFVGTVCASIWARVVHLPSYQVLVDHGAIMSERGHAEVFSADVVFLVIGLVAGLALGGLAWFWFKSLGWWVAAIAAGSGLLAGLLCWGMGQMLGPSSFANRLSEASPGDVIPISLQLHAPGALAGWSLAAVLPTLLVAALGPEPRLDGAQHQPRRGLAAAKAREAEFGSDPGEVFEEAFDQGP